MKVAVPVANQVNMLTWLEYMGIYVFVYVYKYIHIYVKTYIYTYE